MKLRFALIGLTLTSVAALSAANAADMYVAPVAGPVGYKDDPYIAPTWAGFYAGVNGGYGWNSDNSEILFHNNFGAIGSSNGFKPEGGFGGGQIGYNWQGVWHPHLVLGIEADIQGSGISDSFTQPNVGGTTLTATKDIDYFGTIRGRVGYAFDHLLVYGTGGFAFGGVKNRLFLTNGVSSADLTRDDTETGFAAGGGIEYAIAPSWSFKVEYQYIDLGSYKLSAGTVPPSTTTVFSNSIDNTFNTVRAGLNYHIGSTYEPLK